MSYAHDLQADQTVGQTAPLLRAVPLQTPPAPHHDEPVLTLYQVPVPGAIEVTLPNGRTAWAKEVEARLDPIPTKPHEPMPSWAKGICLVSGGLTVLVLGSAVALRIAAPTFGDLVDVLDMIWRVTLALAVIFFGAGIVVRRLLASALGDNHATGASRPQGGGHSEQHIVIAPQIDTGGNRLIGRSGDVNFQFGDGNRNKQ
ncbi:hypothetical protein [Streptomyces sp. NBC_00989]|uniref:hypothetical protein n=1 Tax=Streptomyces sp. NBC_00989 TaxID=2903705 RepID=UPI002F910CEF|nr:hypothetical protein OG714_54945 [Streptomyces sp. NBC_00989]